MIGRVKQHPQLKSFLAQTCEERGISANMDGDIPAGNYVIIKVDNYYNHQKMSKTPPSIDCLIIQRCSDGSFMIYLIELKNIKSPKGFNSKQILKKFNVTVNDFMSIRFKDIFLHPDFKIKEVRPYFVTNPYRIKDKTTSHRRQGTKMKTLLSMGNFEFNNKTYQLREELPNPVIQPC
jgi:hypothetical protein